MEAPNYRIKYKEKKPFRILIIIAIIILLLIILRPLTWLRKTLAIKSLEYKSTHEPVYFSSLKIEGKNLPMAGKITKSYLPDKNGINITPILSPSEVRIIDIGTVVDIGYNETEKNYIKVRHVSESKKDIYFTYYSNLPEMPKVSKGDWIGSSTIIYSGTNLNYLHFEVLDFDGNNIDPTGYINIE